jgi:hypothetical protein
MVVVEAPNRIVPKHLCNLFLAGSIEMGKAEDWQTKVIQALDNPDILIFNPRRKDWDKTWEQSITNEKFREQVNWEMDGLDQAKLILFYFDPNTMSPISLLELGYCSGISEEGLTVCCPKGFWRKGNVEILCYRKDIMFFEDLDKAIEHLKKQIEKNR